MARVKTKAELIEYCKRRLGYPLANIEVTAEQAADRVDEAVQYFLERADVGNERVTYILDTTEKKHEYTLDDGIAAVIEVVAPSDGGDFTTSDFLFSTTNTLVQADLLNPRFIAGSLSYLQVAREYAETMRFMLAKSSVYDYNPATRRIIFEEKPPADFLVLTVYRTVNPSDPTAIVYDHPWVKRYACALIKQQWGQNLGKYRAQLPGGIELRGDEIYSQAQTDIERLEEDLEETYTAPPMFIVA